MRSTGLGGSCALVLVVSCGLGTAGLQPQATSGGPHDGGVAPADAASGGGPQGEAAAPQGGGPDASAGHGPDAAGDAGADGAVATVDGAAFLGDGGPTPGSVTCAGTACAISSNICCTCPGCFPPFPTSCFPSFPGCVTGVPVQCDDRTDCASGQVCCGKYSGATFSKAACQASCASADVQLCNVDAECAHGTCKPSTALPGFATCM
jgi:hypothetical protein